MTNISRFNELFPLIKLIMNQTHSVVVYKYGFRLRKNVTINK